MGSDLVGLALVFEAVCFGEGFEAVPFAPRPGSADGPRQPQPPGNHQMSLDTPSNDTSDVVVVGGGPAGATAAEALARQGRKVLLLDRAGRVQALRRRHPAPADQGFCDPY